MKLALFRCAPRRAARSARLGCLRSAGALALGLGLGLGPAVPAARAAGLPSTNVAWQAAAGDADIERAFVRARAEGKPVLLYWGATWCPPCNQLKATLFGRQEFAALAKGLVAVHVDGDLPGAQKLGSRFKVSGYPTMVLFTPAGQEVTRLPGEVDAPQALAVLQLGLAGGRPVKAVLAEALAGKALSAGEWRLLAFYSWETDEQQLVPKAELPTTLARLALASAPAANALNPVNAANASGGAAETTTRLWLRALAASDDGKGLKADEPLRQRVLQVLGDARAARAQMDVLTNGAADIVRTLEDEASPRRAPLLAAYDAAMKQLEADASLSRADRLGALLARVDLARLAEGGDALHPKLPAPLLAELREHVARADREISNGYERQAVITGAAYALGRAGLWADSDTLLEANLAKSHSPYYLMSQLGSNARKLGRKDEALRWYGEAFDKAAGPATRLQWGAGYLSALVDLAPHDAARIERLAAQLLREAAADAGAFEGRSVRSLQRLGAKLVAWNGEGRHAAVMKRLQGQLDGVCAGLAKGGGAAGAAGAAEARGACLRLLKPAAPARTAQRPQGLLVPKAA